MRTMLRTATVALLACLAPAVTLAEDLEWSQTAGLLYYDTASHWTPNKTPTDSDNVTFSIEITPEPQIIIGAPSQGNNVNVTNYDWTFSGGVGATLDTEGILTVDDPTGTTIANGANLTLLGVNWDNHLHAVIGDVGTGGLTIDGGADLSVSTLYIGDDLGSEGEVTVDGAGATLTSDAVGMDWGIFIGHAGSGTLNVTGGGFVETLDTSGIADISLGYAATGEGTLNITGAGSRVISEDLIVGEGGTGHLTVSGGGAINCTIGSHADAYVGSAAAASGDVTITGDGSVWNARDIRIGVEGTGTLDIEAGGKADAAGQFIIGELATGSGTVTLNGSGTTADSLLEVGGTLTVGHLGEGTLDVEAGADVTVGDDLLIGTDAASTFNHTVTVTGSGSEVTVSDHLEVGQSGKGTLNVLDGAHVSATNWTSIARVAGSEGTVTVDGTGSTLCNPTGHNPTGIAVGFGTGRLDVTGGGLVQVPAFYVGRGDLGAGDGTVVVSGSDGGTPSTLDVTGTSFYFYVGGSVYSDGGVGEMTISAGGRVRSNGLVIGGGDGGVNDGTGTVTVTGNGSLINARHHGTEALCVGGRGHGTLNVEAGGQVQAAGLAMGYEAGTETASMTVDGGTSSVDVTGGVTIGSGRAAQLTIQNGGQLTSGTDDTSTAVIGYASTANGASVTVDGAGSLWNHQGSASANHAMVVGVMGGNQAPGEWSLLNVTNGGKVLAHDLRVAEGSTAGAGWVVVDGQDGANNPSTISANGSVIIGDDAGGKLTVSAGGLFETTTSYVHIGQVFTGDGIVSVTGVDSRLSAATSLVVGVAGSGQVTIEDGGMVSNGTHACIGYNWGSTGLVTVGDSGASVCTWNVGANLIVGGGYPGMPTTGAGTLTINPSGQVNVGGQLWMLDDSEPGGSSTVNLAGGTISVGSTDIVSGFNFNSGTFRYTGSATLDADTLNDLLGATPTLVADQELDVVGTATLDAPLRLNGGTFGVGSIADLANLDFDAGTFNLTSDNLTVGAGGLLGTDPTITAVQAVNVTNNVTIDTGSQFTVVGGFSSGATANNGDLILIDTTSLGKTIAGDLNTPAGSTVPLVGDITFTGAVSGAGGFYGPGTAHFDGGYSPGDSFAQVPFEGSVAFGATNTLSIEIGGTVAGDEHDQVNVAGQAALDGTLAVSLIEPFEPEAGDAFTVLTYGSRSGEFAGITGWEHSELAHLAFYDANGLTLHCTYFGDATLDGCVDGADYTAWADNYNQSGGWTDGDFAEDGFIDGADYTAWADNYSSCGSPVPEPALTVVLLAGAWGVRRPRRARRIARPPGA